MSSTSKTLLGACLFCLLGCGSGFDSGVSKSADHVFINGGVYTVNPDEPWAQAVAVRDKHILMVGDNSDVEKLIGSETVVTDLTGRMLLPGFGDSHLHLLYGGEIVSRCGLDWVEVPEEIKRILEQCAQNLPLENERWIHATGWARSSFPEGIPPPEFLNELFPSTPVVVEASDGHSIWVNQVALDLAGINGGTQNPENGSIERHPQTGSATGLLHESAIRLVYDVMPMISRKERLGFIRKATTMATEFGITSAIEPGLNIEQAKLFREFDEAGELNLRLLLALTPLGFKIASFDEEIYATVSKRSDIETHLIKTHSVKVFIDGVIENGTAPLLEPYLPESVVPLDTFYTQKELQDYFISFDKAGLSIHVHAIGDQGIRQTLDAFAAMREANGISDGRHIMTHLQLVNETDLGRFEELGIIASFSTLWAYPESYNLEIYPPLVGRQRVDRFYPVASIMDTGGIIVIGSDWSVDEMNPFLAIEVAITRQDPYSDQGSIFNERERIDLESALKAYTINVAYAMGLEDELGSVEVGKLGDLIVLDRNLFDIPVYQISDTKVQLTMFDGDVVFEGSPSVNEP